MPPITPTARGHLGVAAAPSGGTAESLHRPAAALVGQAAFPRDPGGMGGTARRWVRNQRLTKYRGEPDSRYFPVAQLGAVLGGHDREHAVDQSPAQTLQDSSTLRRGERRAGRHIEDQLDARIGGIHPLAARPTCARKAPPQLGLRNRDRATHQQRIGHLSSMPADGLAVV